MIRKRTRGEWFEDKMKAIKARKETRNGKKKEKGRFKGGGGTREEEKK